MNLMRSHSLLISLLLSTLVVFLFAGQVGTAEHQARQTRQQVGGIQLASTDFGSPLTPQTAQWLSQEGTAALHRWDNVGSELITGLVSPGWFEWVMPLADGRVPTSPGEVVAMAGGPYPLGTLAGSQRVVGLAQAPLWDSYPDTTLFRLAENPNTVDVLVARTPERAGELSAALPFMAGRWQSVADVVLGLEGQFAALRTLRLQLLASAMLFVLAVLALLLDLRTRWLREREEHRLLRVLGLSRARMERQWFAGVARRWLGVLLPALALTAVWTLLQGSALGWAAVGQGALWATAAAALLSAFVLVAAALLVRSASAFPLGRVDISAPSSWREHALSALAAGLVVAGGSFGLQHTLGAYRQSLAVLASTGADRIDVRSLPTTTRSLAAGDCERLMAELNLRACGSYRVTGMPIEVGGQLQRDLDDLVLYGSGLQREGLRLNQGRWPTDDREVVAGTAMAERLAALGTVLGAQVRLSAFGSEFPPYTVTGVADAPSNDTALHAALYLPETHPVLGQAPATHPFGSSGLALRVANLAQLNDDTRARVRAALDEPVSVSYPATLRLTWHRQQSAALITVIAMLILGTAIALQVFLSSVAHGLALRRDEYGLMRDLGAGPRRLRGVAAASFLHVPVIAGAAALALPVVLAIAGLLPMPSLAWLGLGAALLALLAALGWLAVALAVRQLRQESVHD